MQESIKKISELQYLGTTAISQIVCIQARGHYVILRFLTIRWHDSSLLPTLQCNLQCMGTDKVCVPYNAKCI